MSRLAVYARLLRVSNAPTAVADVWMGMAVATGGFAPLPVLALLTAASLLAYHGGMALNDAVDAEADAADDRGRPIADGAVSRREAYLLAGSMLIGSIVLTLAVSARIGSVAPAAIAVALVACVVAYNTRWKRTAAGPVLMGACRALNGLLGMSPALTGGVALLVAPGVLLYVVGLTFFARDEARGGERERLAAAVFVALLGVVWLAAAPWASPLGRWPSLGPVGWWTLWAAVILHVMGAFTVALLWPSPKRVQRAVGRGIVAIVVIDAALALGYAGVYHGATILLMAPLTKLLARFIPQT